MQTIVLPISPAYIDHWTLAQGIKELVSNCCDSVNRQRDLMEFEGVEREDGTVDLTIGNKIIDGKLEPRHLVLGVSENRNKETAIGQFGEGMKLAFITLLRNGIHTFVENDDERWMVSLTRDETFGTELPHIHITEEEPTGYVRFHLKGLDKQTVVDVMAMVWEFLPQGLFEIGDEDTTIRYLSEDDEDYAGLFVGGIFMGELHPRFAINTSPVGIPVNRDRKLPNDLVLVKERCAALLANEFKNGELVDDTDLRRTAFVQLMTRMGLFTEMDENLPSTDEKNQINLWLELRRLEQQFDMVIDDLREIKFCSDYCNARANHMKYVSWEVELRLRRVAKVEEYGWLAENIVEATTKNLDVIYYDLLSNTYAALKAAGMKEEAAKKKAMQLVEDLRVYAGEKGEREWE